MFCLFFLRYNEIHSSWSKATSCLDCALSLVQETNSQAWLNLNQYRGKNSVSYYGCMTVTGQLGCLFVFILTIGQYLIAFNH